MDLYHFACPKALEIIEPARGATAPFPPAAFTLPSWEQQQFRVAPDSAREPAPASLVTCSPLNPETLAIIGQNPGHCYGARLLQACHFFPGRNVRALHSSGGGAARDHQPCGRRSAARVRVSPFLPPAAQQRHMPLSRRTITGHG